MKLIIILSLIALSWATPTWHLVQDSIATILMGITCPVSQTCFIPCGYADGTQKMLKTSDGGKTWLEIPHAEGGGLIWMATRAQTELSCVVSGLMGSEFMIDGINFNNSIGGFGTVQNVESLPYDGIYGLVGADLGCVSITEDYGLNYVGVKCDIDTDPRYAAYPTLTTWYLSGGEWPEDKSHFQINRFLHIKHDENSIHNRLGIHFSNLKPSNNDTGWKAVILKTTDSGKTWKTLVNVEKNYYFNGIHCADENNCMVCAEGGNDPKTAGSHVFVTHDGGATWTDSLFDPGVPASMIQVRMLSKDEAWACGGYLDSLAFAARFWHTLDGGKTWEKSELPGYYCMDMSFIDPNNAFAAALNVMSAGSVLAFN